MLDKFDLLYTHFSFLSTTGLSLFSFSFNLSTGSSEKSEITFFVLTLPEVLTDLSLAGSGVVLQSVFISVLL